MNILFLSFVIKIIFFKTNVIGKLLTTTYIHDLELPSTKIFFIWKNQKDYKGFIIPYKVVPISMFWFNAHIKSSKISNFK